MQVHQVQHLGDLYDSIVFILVLNSNMSRDNDYYCNRFISFLHWVLKLQFNVLLSVEPSN